METTETTKCWCCGEDIATDGEFCSRCGNPYSIDSGRYIIEHSAGEGSFAVVYECHDSLIGRKVAIKVLKRPYDKVLESRDILAASHLNSPNIVAVYDILPEENAIVMEYMPGGTLAERMKEDLGWVQDNFATIILGICSGLRTAHASGIVHRDIKPENILFTANGTAKISDFGVCTLFDNPEDATCGVAGTYAYMALDVMTGNKYGYEADTHSLGCIIYEIWSGELPWKIGATSLGWIAEKANNSPKRLDNIDDELSGLLDRMLEGGNSDLVTFEPLECYLRKIPLLFDEPARSIDDIQLYIGAIYGYANGDKSLHHLLDQYFIATSETLRSLKAYEFGFPTLDKTGVLLAKQFCWLCAVASAANIQLGHIIDLKYPEKCPYCESDPCICQEAWEGQREERNARLLQRIMGQETILLSNSNTVEHYQGMFKDLYGEKNSQQDFTSLSMHIHSEIAEAIDAAIHLHPKDGQASLIALHLELSDLVAWYFALLNYFTTLQSEYDLLHSLKVLLKDGCYACNSKPCICPNPEGVANWRDIIRNANG